jgi:hypothetical protein
MQNIKLYSFKNVLIVLALNNWDFINDAYQDWQDNVSMYNTE